MTYIDWGSRFPIAVSLRGLSKCIVALKFANRETVIRHQTQSNVCNFATKEQCLEPIYESAYQISYVLNKVSRPCWVRITWLRCLGSIWFLNKDFRLIDHEWHNAAGMFIQTDEFGSNIIITLTLNAMMISYEILLIKLVNKLNCDTIELC